MNVSNPAQRVRGPPNGAPPAPSVRPVLDHRHDMGGSAYPANPPPNDRNPAGPQMSRAEKFEDEKKRIIESCFGKKEPDGSISESYITHIRIEEDSAYPSSPPPLQSPHENKKPRVIVVAVRKSGRVRMHKARENASGSFSIGKTWVLDDLSVIESFTSSNPTTAEEQQNKQRAGGTGFIVTVQKPYYWTAATAKEKDFFILSLIKIFRKYTGGRLPELHGFSPQELDQLGGVAGQQPRQQPRQQQRPPPEAPKDAANKVMNQEASNFREHHPPAGPEPVQERGSRAPSAREPPPNFSEPSQERRPRAPSGQRAPPPPVPEPHPERRARAPSGQRPLPPVLSEPHPDRRPRPTQDRPSQERTPHSAVPQERSSQERVLHSAVPPDRPLRTARSKDRIHMPGSFPSTDSIHDQDSDISQPRLRPNRSASPAIQAPNSQQPELRRPDLAQNTESFVKSHDDQKATLQPTFRASNEHMRPPNEKLPSTLRIAHPGPQRPATPGERPVNAVKDVPPPNRSQEQKSSIESSDTYAHLRPDDQAFDQISPRRALDSRDGHMRDSSTSSRASGRGARGSPSKNPSESSKDHLPDISRPSTAASHRTQNSQVPVANVTSPLFTANNDDAFVPQSSPTIFPPTPPSETPTEEEVVHRPGLGPMIKKKSNKEIATMFRKAAAANGAFKPRPGGAVEKLRQNSTDSGDGITGVFQAPSLLKGLSQDDIRPASPQQVPDKRPVTPEPKQEEKVQKVATSPVPQTRPISPEPQEPAAQKSPPLPRLPSTGDNTQEERRKKGHPDNSAQYAKALGIDPSLLEGRTSEIENDLNDFGWGEESKGRSTYEEVQANIRKEIARIEAGSLVGAVESNDERVQAVGEMMDKVIAECDELDCLLTLYNVELGTLSEDVAYIEAQSQGLQVQAANQKLLQAELQDLLDTISISPTQLRILKEASLTKPKAIQEVENTLTQVYSAMLTLDPKLRHTGSRAVNGSPASLRNGNSGHGDSDLSNMHAVREKKETYRRESVDFIQRLKQYISVKFQETEAATQDALERNRNSKNPAAITKLDHRLHEDPKQGLWVYSPLMLFAREIEQSEWDDMMRMYEGCAKKPYQDEFKDNIFAWKRITRKPAGDEQDVLFTSQVQEKENEGLVGRKRTVKRTKTVRADGSARISSGDRPQDGKVTAYEAFAGALSEMARIIFVEQNFVVDFFHASSPDTHDFIEAVAIEPNQRRGPDSIVKRPFDPDRNMARKVLGVMEDIYSFWSTDLQNLVGWTIKQDSLNSVGVLFALESQLLELDETNQEYLTQTVGKIHDRVATQFTRFIDEQIRGIEDTKVKIKKRKGIIAFMKTFPNFSIALENMLPPTRSLDHLPIRSMVNNAYEKITKAMFESLKFIAKESPTATQAQAAAPSGDPEDKEALNYHILLIENMNHYIEEVPARNNPVLEDWNFRARAEMGEHMDLYVAAVMRRPLGKLLDFLESTESLLRNSQGGSPAAIATRASHSRSTFKKILSSHDAKETRRGIETLKKRVEKHFSDGEDTAGLSRDLTSRVLKECEARYLDVGDRAGRLVRDVYENSLEVEWRRDDVVGVFRR